jgi:hypothetical protein
MAIRHPIFCNMLLYIQFNLVEYRGGGWLSDIQYPVTCCYIYHLMLSSTVVEDDSDIQYSVTCYISHLILSSTVVEDDYQISSILKHVVMLMNVSGSQVSSFL